jgi:hypothetical protein
MDKENAMRCAMQLFVAGWMLAVLGGVAASMTVDIPMEALAQQSDLIVTAEAVSAGQPAEAEMTLPGASKPAKEWFRQYKVKVKDVIKPAGGVKPGQEIVVVAQAPRPPKDGEPAPVVADGPQYPSLQPGTNYVLLLRKFADKNEYLVPSYAKNYRPVTDEDVARVKRAVDVAKWAWGKPVDGLQIALVPDRSTFQMPLTGRPRVAGVFVAGVVALRNTSDKPITVNLYAGDRYLSIAAVGGGAEAIDVDLYSWLAAARLRAFSVASTASVDPGKVRFISSNGASDYGMTFRLNAGPGKWKLRTAYNSIRDAKPLVNLSLWKGKIESADVEIEVEQAKY